MESNRIGCYQNRTSSNLKWAINLEINKLAKDWVSLQYSTVDQRRNDPLFWAYQKLDTLCNDAPLEALEVIVEILSIDSSDHILSNVGAGPMEDLLSRNGAQVIKEVESVSRTNDAIRKALGGVWRDSIDADVWDKVQGFADRIWDV